MTQSYEGKCLSRFMCIKPKNRDQQLTVQTPDCETAVEVEAEAEVEVEAEVAGAVAVAVAVDVDVDVDVVVLVVELAAVELVVAEEVATTEGDENWPANEIFGNDNLSSSCC